MNVPAPLWRASAADFIPRDPARFSILASEWPMVKQHLLGLLAR
jgi:hypothetical protein